MAVLVEARGQRGREGVEGGGWRVQEGGGWWVVVLALGGGGARGGQMNDAIRHMFPLRASGPGDDPLPLCRSNVNVPMEVYKTNGT